MTFNYLSKATNYKADECSFIHNNILLFNLLLNLFNLKNKLQLFKLDYVQTFRCFTGKRQAGFRRALYKKKLTGSRFLP